MHKKEHDEEKVENQEPLPYNYYEQKMTARHLHYYISGHIEEPSKYTEMIHKIRSATANDVVHLHLNTPGGQVSTGVQIISAIRASQGHVVTHLEGEACSMGALLFLSGDEMVVYDDSLLMFHNYSGGAFGKGHEITAVVDAVNKWYSKLTNTICTPFLSKAELKKIFDGADMWMLSDEVEERLKKMATILQAKEDKKNKKVTKKRAAKKRTKKKVTKRGPASINVD